MEEFRRTRRPPICECGGFLKSATISFGQPLDPDVLARAEEAAVDCDLLLAVGSTLSVYPAAGTPSASPTTQLSFRGVSNLLAGQITVTGSKSGVHGGQVQSHSDGNGVSFIPNTPFKTGETVTVKVTGQSLVGANGSGEVTFRTYTPVPGLKLTPNPDRGGKPDYGDRPTLPSFRRVQ